MLNVTYALVITTAGLLLGACAINTPAASPAASPVVVQERSPPPATVVSPGGSVIVQPRY